MSGQQPIGRIPVVAPVPSILTSARPLSEDVDWLSGVAWTPASCRVSSLWPRCPVADSTKVAPVAFGPKVNTDMFMIYTPVDCDWATDETVRDVAVELTDVHTAFGIGRALWLGEGLPDLDDQPSLRRSSTDVSVGAAMDLDDACALLLSQYEQCTGGNGGAVLHIPSVLIPGALGGIAGGGRVAWPEGNIYRAALGAVVSPGPGYPHGASVAGTHGFGPKTGGANAATTYKGNGLSEAWVYVTGPVEYAVGPIVAVEPVPGSFRMNRREVIAERPAIVRFDPCCVFGALVTNTAGAVS